MIVYLNNGVINFTKQSINDVEIQLNTEVLKEIFNRLYGNEKSCMLLLEKWYHSDMIKENNNLISMVGLIKSIY